MAYLLGGVMHSYNLWQNIVDLYNLRRNIVDWYHAKFRNSLFAQQDVSSLVEELVVNRDDFDYFIQKGSGSAKPIAEFYSPEKEDYRGIGDLVKEGIQLRYGSVELKFTAGKGLYIERGVLGIDVYTNDESIAYRLRECRGITTLRDGSGKIDNRRPTVRLAADLVDWINSLPGKGYKRLGKKEPIPSKHQSAPF